MARVRTSIKIAALPEEIWPWIVDPERVLVWNTNFQDFRILDDGEGGVGAKFHIREEMRGMNKEYKMVVTEWIENERFAAKGFSTEGDELESSYTLESTETGCKVSVEEHFRLEGGAIKNKVLGALFIERGMEKDIQERFQNLKKVVEENRGRRSDG